MPLASTPVDRVGSPAMSFFPATLAVVVVVRVVANAP
jgi:hypothetical protein